MSATFIHFPEDPGVTSYGETKWCHQFMSMYGYTLLDDYEQALVDLDGHQFIYMDPSSETYLDEIPIAADTVYVFGHDSTGFEGIDLTGAQTAKLRMNDEHSIHALVAAIAVANYRWFTQ